MKCPLGRSSLYLQLVYIESRSKSVPFSLTFYTPRDLQWTQWSVELVVSQRNQPMANVVNGATLFEEFSGEVGPAQRVIELSACQQSSV